MARRALLTESEREAISNPESRDNPYVAVSRVRRKINEELTTDVEVLREHHPDLLEELRNVVCEENESLDTATSDSSEATRQEPRVEEEPSAVRSESVEEVSQTARAKAEEILDEKGLSAPRKDAVLAAWDHLRERKSSQRSTFISDVYPDHHAGYGDRDLKNPERAWWKNVIDEHLRDLPNVEAPSKEGAHQWTYTGENDD